MFFVCVRKRDQVCNIFNIVCNNVKCSIYTINNKKSVCVCVCAPARDHFNCFLIPAESTLNTSCLINNHWIKVCFYLCTLTMKSVAELTWCLFQIERERLIKRMYILVCIQRLKTCQSVRLTHSLCRVQYVRASEHVYARKSRRTEGNYIYPYNFGKLHYAFVLSKD